MFGVLGGSAVIQNVKLTDVAIYVTTTKVTAYIGGIAGATQSSDSSGRTGTLIDGCSVSGVIQLTAEAGSDGTIGNQMTGGLVGYQYKGATINSSSQVSLSCVVNGEALAEAGGLVALNNRGLVANCWADSDIYASGSRENGLEGMAVVSTLVACNAGDLVNCYASGDTTTKEYSTYVGMVSGWITGLGKSYCCWYDLDSTMIIDQDGVNQNVDPVESVGTKVSSGVTEEGDAYTGGLVDALTGYTASGYAAIADGLNGTFSAFPIQVTNYGIETTALKTWTYDQTSNLVTFGDTTGTATYVQPECEKVQPEELTLQDGTWYGRDDDKTTVVKITVENGEITATEVLSGETSGDAYDAALEKAKYKAAYGDFTDYAAAAPSRFAGGSGTKSDPYLIADEAQLRYLSSSVNADNSWEGCYFKQTANITLTGGDWQPIGWALYGEVNGAMERIAAYPFRGNYDGGDYTVSGLVMGTESQPADVTCAGLFGLTSGEFITNDTPTGEEQTVTLKNIHLTDVDIRVSTRYQTYAGGLIGCGQNGIFVDNCSVTGVVDVTTSESFNRVGGLAGYLQRGAATNCWTDVEITGETDSSNVYAGGLYGMDNRVTTLNCYTLGDVTGHSTNNNKTHLGGLTGQAGGIHINCYAAGNVISQNTTTDVGGLNGRSGGIAADYNGYYNSEATQKQGNTVNNPNVAVGVNANDSALTENLTGKTAAELASADFAAVLNANIQNNETALEAVNAFLETSSLAQVNYYQGNTLKTWGLQNGVVGFVTSSDSSSSSHHTSSGSSSSGTTYAITAGSAENGTITVSPESAASGDTVTVTVTPNSGYALDELTVTDADGKAVTLTKISDTQYTFVMPSSRVSVTATFKQSASHDCPAKAFTDIDTDQWYHEAVDWAVENSVTTGTTATTFSPDMICTRAQAVTFLYRAAGSPTVSGTNAFTDVSADAYYADAVQWAVSKGITTGTTATTFSPDSICDRAQIVTLLCRYAGSPATTAVNSFTDVPTGSYYEDSVNWAVGESITTGTGNNRFSPSASCTRAQIVTFLYRTAK